MSSGREKYDGTFIGRDNGFTEWGDTFSSKSQARQSITPKRPTKNPRFLESESDFPEENEKDRYLITYSDLITLLLGLFIILYAISNIDSKKYEQVLSAFGSTFGSQRQVLNINTSSSNNSIVPAPKLIDRISELIQEHSFGDYVKLEENERGITIHIMDQILFNSGSAKLEPKSYEVLSKLAELIRGLPNDLRIEGHTDNVPIKSSEFPSNWHLSVARALSTSYYLMDKEKLPQEKLSVVGYSEYKPIASNESPEERSKNRRVDIIIIKE
jgi:chemotaxis protein MotB